MGISRDLIPGDRFRLLSNVTPQAREANGDRQLRIVESRLSTVVVKGEYIRRSVRTTGELIR